MDRHGSYTHLLTDELYDVQNRYTRKMYMFLTRSSIPLRKLLALWGMETRIFPWYHFNLFPKVNYT